MPRKAEIKELTLENFSPYGTFMKMENPTTYKLGEPPVEFYRDMLKMDVGKTNVCFSICRVEPREYIVDISEYHSHCGEANIALDNDIYIHVGPANTGEVPVDEMEIFRVPKGTMVVMNPGVWHHAPFTVNDEPANVIIVLPERTYANDCIAIEIDEEERVFFED